MYGDPRTDPAAGARNLLLHCLEAKPGERLLLLSEDPADGFYDRHAPEAVAAAAEAMGLIVERYKVPFVADARDASPDIWERIGRADCSVFFARLGDQIRFDRLGAGQRTAMVYAMDAGMLGSGYGIASHAGFLKLKSLIDAAVSSAEEIRMTCPLGTDIRGRCPRPKGTGENGAGGEEDVTIRRFPMAVFKPVPAQSFSGKVVINRFLTGTGNRYYDPYDLLLGSPVCAHVEAGRVARYEGSPEEVDKVLRHTAEVGERFGIDPAVVHSWHAGMHPGCAYLPDALDNLARWGNCAFANPRILHFHTCGDYAPGEISWNVVDPTIELDGRAAWEDGVLHPERLAGGAEVLDLWPDIRAVFARPRNEIGLRDSV